MMEEQERNTRVCLECSVEVGKLHYRNCQWMGLVEECGRAKIRDAVIVTHVAELVIAAPVALTWKQLIIFGLISTLAGACVLALILWLL